MSKQQKFGIKIILGFGFYGLSVALFPDIACFLGILQAILCGIAVVIGSIFPGGKAESRGG